MEMVFKETNSEEYYQKFEITTEYIMEERRRIDIVIEGNGRFIPIEVKIEARDQENQCYDYWNYARQIDSDAKIIYLTKYGAKPSKNSRFSFDEEEYLDDDVVVCISFKEHIICWLNKIIRETGNDLNGLLSQYVQAIERECDIMELEERRLLTEYILENEKQFWVSWKLAQAINYAKCEVMYLFFKELEQAMGVFLNSSENKKYGLCKEEEIGYYTYEKQIDLEKGKYSKDPGLNYVFKNIELKKKRQIWLRIEYVTDENVLYVGLLVIDPEFESNENGFLVSNDATRIVREVQNKLRLKNIDYESLFWTGQYLPTGTREYSEEIPNFNEMNQAAIALANPEKRKIVIEYSIEVLRKMLDELIELEE